MAKPTSIRIPEDLLDEIDRYVEEMALDRSAYLRELLRKGFSVDRQERMFRQYAGGEMSQAEVCEKLGWNPWEFLEHLKAKNLFRNVRLEDWLDSTELER